MVIHILQNEIYLLALLSAFIIGGIVKSQGYFLQLYNWLASHCGSNKVILFILSTICGILPIEGRVTVGVPFLDSITHDNHSKSNIGIINYLATHHYYFWSPIEPSVLIFLTALGLSWTTFIWLTLPILLTYFTFLFVFMMFVIKKEEIIFDIPNNINTNPQSWICGLILISSLVLTIILETVYNIDTSLQWVFPITSVLLILLSKIPFKQWFGYINWKILAAVSIIIALGTIVKSYNNEILLFVKTGPNIVVMLWLGFIAAFIMGSSSKYAGIGALIAVAIGNISYLPLILVIEYVGYILSPTHKCVGISVMAFKTRIIDFYIVLVLLSICLVTSAIIPLIYQIRW